MQARRVHSVFFSATGTTLRVLRAVAGGVGAEEVREYNVTSGAPAADVDFTADDTVLFGMPVYAGRIPAPAAEALEHFRGKGTAAIVVCVYGNRAYDDALVELRDIVVTQGFIPFAAGAFVARHSIFPAVGAGRPDDEDIEKARGFGRECRARLESGDLKEVAVPGTHPYREPGRVPLHPRVNLDCNRCGTCVKSCPAGAIPAKNPKMTYGALCISCARCISVCPQHARYFGGIVYSIARRKFQKKFSARREPETFIS